MGLWVDGGGGGIAFRQVVVGLGADGSQIQPG